MERSSNGRYKKDKERYQFSDQQKRMEEAGWWGQKPTRVSRATASEWVKFSMVEIWTKLMWTHTGSLWYSGLLLPASNLEKREDALESTRIFSFLCILSHSSTQSILVHLMLNWRLNKARLSFLPPPDLYFNSLYWFSCPRHRVDGPRSCGRGEKRVLCGRSQHTKKKRQIHLHC
jgi:hypothetical protein